jgi:serine/threonine protein kinase/tetratricopeptide (TPR) repeat protein
VLDGKYCILAPIGRGGMGVVYSAERLSLGDTVAVKLLLPSEQPGSRARFLREARAAARIRHPSVVQVFDYGDPEGGTPYIVMELLEGLTLAEELRKAGPFTVERSLSVFADICAAVEAGHRRGVVHRDLKPNNVILARTDDGGGMVKVLDFGIASLAGQPDAPAITGPGAVLGTYSYMAPEQASGAQADPRSDVFSLGVVLYEMLTRHLPFAAATPIAAMMRLTRGDHTPITTYLPALAPSIVAAVQAALSLDADRRPVSPEALARLAGAPVHAMRAPYASVPDSGATGELRPGRDPSSGVQQQWSDATVIDVGPPDLERHFSPRTQELARLDEQLRASQAGSGKVTLVTGEAGVGKTRIARAFLAKVAAAGVGTMSARFYDYEGSRLPAFDALERMVFGPAASPTNPERPDSERDGEKWRRFAALATALEQKAASTPLVLCLDDLQWAATIELELLAHLQRTLDPKRVFLMATARTAEAGTELARWTTQLVQRGAAAIVEVQPFSSEQVRDWLLAAFGTLRIRPNDRRRVERVTGNNPQRLLELVRHLLTTGIIHRDELHGVGDWSCADLEGTSIPESMTSVVRATLADVDDELRSMLEIAAVIGDEQRFATLAAATGLAETELEGLVDHAIELHLLTDVGVSRTDDLRLSSDTVRRVLYEDMPARRRKRAHQRVVGALEQLYAKDLRRIARVLCYHHHGIGSWSQALSWGIASAEDDLALHANDGAAASLQLARDSAKQLREAREEAPPGELARLDGLTGTLYTRVGRFGEATEFLSRAAAYADGPPPHRVDALLDLAQCWLGRGDYEKALASAGEASQRAAEAADGMRVLVAQVLRAGCLTRLGRAVEAESVLERALAVAGTDVSPGVRAQALRELSWIATKRGAFGAAETRAREALDLAKAAGDPVGQHSALSALAAAYNECGDPASALPFQNEALRIARALSLRRREAIELANLGESYMTLGQVSLAERHFREALAIFLEIDDRACEGDCRVNVGRALLAGGAREAAIAMLERGRKLCAATGRVEYAALALLHLGEAHRVQGDLPRADEAFEEARRMFLTQASHNVWRASHGLATVALARGESALARRHAEDARDRLVEQRKALAVGASAEAIDRSLAEVAYVIEIAGGPRGSSPKVG